MTHLTHDAGCGCLPTMMPHLSRRGVIGLGMGAALVATFPAVAASGS